MSLRGRLGPGVRSVESFRASMGAPRPASVREMLRGEVALRFVGFHCFGETDELSGSDEPYFTFGVVPSVIEGKGTHQRFFQNVDAGMSVADELELYRGLPLGAVVSVTLAERDQGDPEKYKANVDKAVDTAAEKGIAAMAEIPVVGLVLAALATIAHVITGPALTDFINEKVGSDDDTIGTEKVTITPEDMLRFLQEERQNFEGISAHVESPLISDGEASYKAYFDVIRV